MKAAVDAKPITSEKDRRFTPTANGRPLRHPLRHRFARTATDRTDATFREMVTARHLLVPHPSIKPLHSSQRRQDRVPRARLTRTSLHFPRNLEQPSVRSSRRENRHGSDAIYTMFFRRNTLELGWFVNQHDPGAKLFKPKPPRRPLLLPEEKDLGAAASGYLADL